MVYVVIFLILTIIALSFIIDIVSEKLIHGAKLLEEGAERLRLGTIQYNRGLRRFRRHSDRWYSFFIAEKLEDGYNRLVDGEEQLREGQKRFDDGQRRLLFWTRMLSFFYLLRGLSKASLCLILIYIFAQFALLD